MSWLVIDLGSSSIRALLFDGDARLIPGAIRSRRHDFTTDQQGRAVADPERVKALTEACLDDILQHPVSDSIRAVGMASFAGNWLGLDSASRPCTPLFTYADTRARAQIPSLLSKLDHDPEAYHQASGCILHPAYLPAQYAWLRAERPDWAARLRRVIDIGGYLYDAWFGTRTPMSYSVASWSGLLETRRRRWHADFARLLSGDDALPGKLPRLEDYDATQTGLSPAYARRWSALRSLPFFLAIGDGAAANVGSGAVTPGTIALTVGTTSALRAVRHTERVPPGLWRYLIAAGLPLLGGATSEGGNVYQWALEQLALEPRSLQADLKARLPDQHGLTVLPLLAGERSPGWQAGATGTIHGLRRDSSGLDILQAALEAVAMRLSLIFDLLKDEDSAVMAGGGALQASPAWAQMMADAFDSPLHLLAEPEITARGVALMMRHKLDGIPLDADPPAISRVVQPQPRHAAIFSAARDRQLALYRRLYSD